MFDFFDPQQIAVYPLTDLGLLALEGEDRLRFLHNQTTNDIQSQSPGQWLETIFVNSVGRTLDLATVYVDEDRLWIQVSAAQRQPLLDWMDRYIFPFDKVALADLSDEYRAVILLGDQAVEQLQAWQLNIPVGGQWSQQAWSGHNVLISPQTGLDLPGFTLLIPTDAIEQLAACWQSLPVMTDQQWQTLRVFQGRPQEGRELTEDYNPLEVGLWRAVSFEKGCYIGQETIARVNTYKAVKQQLRRLQLAHPVPVGTTVTVEGQKVGIVTSVAPTPPAIALAYLKTKYAAPGQTVTLGETTGLVEAAPYLRHEYYQPSGSDNE